MEKSIEDIMKETDELLKNCRKLDREMEAMKHGVEFLINEYNTNKRWFKPEGGRVTIEDVIKSAFEFGWSSKIIFDNKENNEYENKVIA